MNRIAVHDLDTGTMIPVGDPDNWRFVRMLFASAEVLNGFVPHRVPIHELVEAHIWKHDWNFLPEIPMPEPSSDELGIVCNEDQTR